MSRNIWAGLASGVILVSLASVARAQDPEAGSAAGTDNSASVGASGGLGLSGSSDTGATAEADTTSATTSTSATTTTTTTTSYNTPTEAAAVAPGDTDHATVVGKLGVGYMGYRTVTYGTDPGSGATASVEAPVIGVRYWMDADMGIDVGLGLNLATASSTAEAGGMSTDTENPQPFAVVLHGGVPLALHNGRHFSFQVVPELNIGYATNTIEADPDDISQSGLHLDIGARAGAEIQFGFMDIPELSLQAGVGVGLSFDSQSSEAGDTSFSQSRTSFGTLTGENPWQIFQANVAALYYFGG